MHGVQTMTPRDSAPLVCIHWRDARHATNQWQYLGDYRPQECIEVMSVGWMIQDDDEAKVLSQSLAGVDDEATELQVAGLKVIPTSAVISIDVIAETERLFPPERNQAPSGRDLEAVG